MKAKLLGGAAALAAFSMSAMPAATLTFTDNFPAV
jgi:hypothetical protein